MTQPTNWDRADFAAAALQEYHSETRFDTPTYGDEGSEAFTEAFGDMLCDMQHLADRAGVDFEDMLDVARRAYAEEVAEAAHLTAQNTTTTEGDSDD